MAYAVISYDAGVKISNNTGTIRIKLNNNQVIPFQNLNMDTFNGIMRILNESPVYYDPTAGTIYVGVEPVD